MGELPQQLIVQAALILLNAFFAATEIAVISLNTAKLSRISFDDTDRHHAGRIPGQRVCCGELLRQPDKLDL